MESLKVASMDIMDLHLCNVLDLVYPENKGKTVHEVRASPYMAMISTPGRVCAERAHKILDRTRNPVHDADVHYKHEDKHKHEDKYTFFRVVGEVGTILRFRYRIRHRTVGLPEFRQFRHFFGKDQNSILSREYAFSMSFSL